MAGEEMIDGWGKGGRGEEKEISTCFAHNLCFIKAALLHSFLFLLTLLSSTLKSQDPSLDAIVYDGENGVCIRRTFNLNIKLDLC
jgi:hypothetical protein